MRFRSILLLLSRALFGADLVLSDFPRLRSIRGLGISDSDVYCRYLADRFSYINTYFDREPRFDLLRPDEGEFGKYDFVICSEVLEHVPAPVERAFQTLALLLKPAGLLILTAPFSLSPETVEHFPTLNNAGIADVAGRLVLVNRSKVGTYEVFDQIAFHGGDGATLEMRVFSEADIRSALGSAGFSSVEFETRGNGSFGVHFSGPCSLPILAAKNPFTLSHSGVRELIDQILIDKTILQSVKDSRWVRLGRLLRVGPRVTAV